MALSFRTVGSGLQRTSGGFLQTSGSFTFSYWLQLSTPVSAQNRTYSFLVDPSGISGYIIVYGSSTSGLILGVDNGPSALDSHTTVIPLLPNVWMHIAVTYTAGTHTTALYLNGSLVASLVLDLTATMFGLEQLGFSQFTPLTGLTLAYYRSWAVALTSAQIATEMTSQSAVNLVQLFSETTLFDTTSSSITDPVAGRNWTIFGTGTEVQGPQVGLPLTNLTAATALDIGSAPFGCCQSVHTTQASNVWFSYTAQPSDTVLSLWVAGAAASYVPTVTIYDGLQNAQTSIPLILNTSQAANNAVLQVSLQPGRTYYILAGAPNPSANPAILVMSAVLVTHTTGSPSNHDLPLPGGFTIAVPGDASGNPLVWVGATNGLTRRGLAAFPAAFPDTSARLSTFSHVLPSGVLMVTGSLNGPGVFLYDANYQALTAPVNLTFPAASVSALTSDRVQLFYVAGYVTGYAQVTTVEPQSGLQGTTIWRPTFTGGPANQTQQIIAMAPSLDNSRLHYIGGTVDGVGEALVRVWDLVNNVALPPITSPPVNYRTQGLNGRGNILVLQDKSLVVSYVGTNPAMGSVIYQVTVVGVIMRIYTFAAGTINWLAHATNDPASFWVEYTRLSDGFKQWLQISTADGSTLATTGAVVPFTLGYSQEPLSTSPSTRVGPASPGQFWVPPLTAAVNLTVPTQWRIHRLDVKTSTGAHA